MNYVVREARESEWAALVRVTNAAFQVENFFKCADRTSLEDVRRQVNEHGAHFLVAVDEKGAVCASIEVEATGERAYFGMLAVDPTLQRSGLGRRMVSEAEQWGVERDCSRMEMCIIHLREDLPNYYHSLGYVDSHVGDVYQCDLSDFKVPVKLLYMVKPLTPQMTAR